MQLSIITIFPDYFSPLHIGLLGKAIEKNLVQVDIHDLRTWATDVHHSVDDTPYGGGPGMVMKPTVWGEALDAVCPDEALLLVPSPAGQPFTQRDAQEWSTESQIVFACGRYEGIDQRVIDDAQRRVRVREVSLGDYVLIGGESAVLVIAEAVCRLLPGILGNAMSHQCDSFQNGLLEAPQYTRPQIWRGLAVPEVLLSGNHAQIEQWRQLQSIDRTRQVRPDLLSDYE